MSKTKGFITVATGSEEYYRLANNLLHSYRYFCKNPLPFAILADKENGFTKDFDDVILFENGATNSYLDKLSLGEYLPYDINIFIDADCLAFDDINILFDYFETADDFSCFGRVLPLDDTTGWFEYKNLGNLQESVSYVVGLHGGIYYMRKGNCCQRVFDDAKAFVKDYKKYSFKGNFASPGDEPLIALSMAVNNCRPIPFKLDGICCYWEHVNHMDIALEKGKALVKGNDPYNAKLLHWGTRYTRELIYKQQVELLSILETTKDDEKIRACNKKYEKLIHKEKRNKVLKRVVSKVKRTIGLK